MCRPVLFNNREKIIRSIVLQRSWPFAFDNVTHTHTHTNTHTFYPSSKGRRRSNKKRETVEGVQRRKWAISFVTSIQRDGSRRPDGNPTEWVHIDPGYPPPPPLLHPLFPGETAPRPVANDGCTFTIVFTLLERGQGGVMINFPCTN